MYHTNKAISYACMKSNACVGSKNTGPTKRNNTRVNESCMKRLLDKQ